MLKTAVVFLAATVCSLVVLLSGTGLLGLWAPSLMMALAKRDMDLLALLFAWVPVWLWVAAIRRVWHGSPGPESERETHIM